jgi:hypothetical protein
MTWLQVPGDEKLFYKLLFLAFKSKTRSVLLMVNNIRDKHINNTYANTYRCVYLTVFHSLAVYGNKDANNLSLKFVPAVAW